MKTQPSISRFPVLTAQGTPRGGRWRGRVPFGLMPAGRAATQWLKAPGSLTHRLRRLGPFAVVSRWQGRALLGRDEFAAVGLSRRQVGLVRNVVLTVSGRPMVVAHSVVSRVGLQRAWRQLSGLGNRPLAEVLYHDPAIVRAPLAYCRLSAQHPLGQLAWAVAPAAFYWARRSCFWQGGYALLVTEIFLPSLLQAIKVPR